MLVSPPYTGQPAAQFSLRVLETLLKVNWSKSRTSSSIAAVVVVVVVAVVVLVLLVVLVTSSTSSITSSTRKTISVQEALVGEY